MKNSFVLYSDYREHIELLSMEQRGMLLTAIMAYTMDDNMPDMDGMTKMAFSFIKAQMDRDNERYERTVEARKRAGQKGGKARQEKAKEANAIFAKQKEANQADTDNDTVTDNDTDNKKTIKRFSPPDVNSVQSYCTDRNNSVDAQVFVDFYDSKGWMVGKNKMKDWKAAVRTWEKNNNGQTRQEVTAKRDQGYLERDYNMDSLELQILRSQEKVK